MNHEGKRPVNDLHFMIYDSLFDILRFNSLSAEGLYLQKAKSDRLLGAPARRVEGAAAGWLGRAPVAATAAAVSAATTATAAAASAAC